MLRLQPYSFDIIHQPGSSNPADYLSRHIAFQSIATTKEEKLATSMVNYVCRVSVPKHVPREDIEAATLADATMQAVMKALYDGRWYSHIHEANVDRNAYQIFRRIQTELSVTDDNNLLLQPHRNPSIAATTSYHSCSHGSSRNR